ncbi:MAG: ribose 5-phosphate isomerase A [Bacteroidota bacterium]|nr:ribose 5-phosphate isomerase A [Bacteroidota bacterium]
MNFKQEAARKASTLVKNNYVVGLGAGSTMASLAEFLKERMENGLSIRLVTSSYSTMMLLQEYKIPVMPIASFKKIDIYFDGCDQFDQNLNALKSGGGIHMMEKLLASMAKQFILVGDETKLVDKFDLKYPLVLEILPQAVTFIPHKIGQLFRGIKMIMRMNDKRDGPVITGNGNYLLDVYFKTWPELPGINPLFKSIPGIVETSLFYEMAYKAIIAGEKGITVLKRC